MITMMTFANLFAIFILSLIANLILLVNIKLGLFGLSVKNKVNNILEHKNYLFYIFMFFTCLFILIMLNSSVIYLDDTKNVLVETVTVNNGTIKISGEAANAIFNNLGSSAVFVAGARIAAGLVSKNTMGLLPKVGTIGFISAGFTISFKIITNALDNRTLQSPSAGVTTVEIQNFKVNNNINTSNLSSETKSLLKEKLGINKDLKLNLIKTQEDVHISAEPALNRSIMEQALDRDLTWQDSIIPSPLENSEISNPIKNFLIEALTNNLTLHFIILYLMMMFIIIFTCKIILENGYQFNGLKQNKLGSFIHYYLLKYISLWENRTNIWLYFIGFSLLFFNLIGTYSIYHTITIINNHL